MITIEEKYDVNAEVIWNALTNLEQIKKWHFDFKNYNLEVGNIFTFYEPNGNKFLHECEILEIIPNKVFKHSWSYPQLSKGNSIVTWTIIEQENGTRLILTHEHLNSFEDGGKDFAVENFQAGWTEILGKSLKEFVTS
jgi:uncharacterized protein YndB with AHSA1/START domain